MKRYLPTLVLLLCFSIVKAQTFSYSGVLPAPIPDNNTLTSFPIVVSGLPTHADSTFGLSTFCISVQHPQVSDLKIGLVAPDGTTIILSNHNGNGGSNFTGTCFSMTGANFLTGAFAPFTGTFLPDQSLNILNNGQDPNGTWYLTILDDFPFFSGNLVNAMIGFSINPPPNPASLQFVCSTTNSTGCMCKDTTLSDCDLLPDLICSYVIIRNGMSEALGHIGFPNAVINVGSGPLEMKPTGNCFCDSLPATSCSTPCPGGQMPKEGINQRIYHKNQGGLMSFYDRPAGFQRFDIGHNHVHVSDFTSFSLRVPSTDPNPANWPMITNSIKQGYCLVNMGTCSSIDSLCMSHGIKITDVDLPNLNLGIITGCGTQGQGVFVGRYDMYGSGNGQEIVAPNICNGDYYIVAIIDPFNNFIEQDETNNVIAVPVHLSNQAGTALNSSFVYTISGFNVGFINYTPNVTQTWNFGDGTTGSGVALTHQYTTSGIYTVTCTVFNGTCSSTTAQTVTVGVVGIPASESGIYELAVRPNPSNENFNLEFQLINPSKVTVSVFNVLGKEVLSFPSEVKLSGKHIIELINLPEGAYFVRVDTSDKSLVRKIVRL